MKRSGECREIKTSGKKLQADEGDNRKSEFETSTNSKVPYLRT